VATAMEGRCGVDLVEFAYRIDGFSYVKNDSKATINYG